MDKYKEFNCNDFIWEMIPGSISRCISRGSPEKQNQWGGGGGVERETERNRDKERF